MQLKRITLCVALAFAPAAFAAETATLDEVVVTAPAMEQPLVVETDPRKPRQPVPAHDGADYLKTIPGFNVVRKGGTDGDPVLRGMAGSRLNILLDGEQILGGCSQRMDPPTAYVFPSSYDKITVLKGPQSVLYGAGTSAGTVMFERAFKRRDDTGAGFDGSVMAGSFGRTDVAADVHGGSPDWYGRAIYTDSRAGDYKDGNGNSVHSAYARWSANAAIGLTPNENVRAELSMAKSDGHAAYADRTMDGSKFARDNVGLKADWKSADHGLLEKVEVQMFHNYIDHVMDSYSLRTGGNPAGMMAAMNPDRTTDGGRVMGTMNFSEATQLKLGLDTQSNVHTGRTGAAPGFMGAYNLKPRAEDARFRNEGLFGELSHQLGDDARIVGGLRADRWNAKDSRTMLITNMMMMTMAMNPTANQSRSETLKSGFVRYERDVLDSAGTFYVGLGHAERAPDFWELFYKETATSLSAFGTTRPEKNNQLDVGMTYKHGDVSGSLSGFYNKISDYNLIESGCKTNMGNTFVGLGATCGMGQRLVSMTRNISATTWGGEASASWQFAQQWKADGSLAYVQGSNDTDGTALSQMSPLEGRMGMTYDNGVWNVGGLLRMVAAQNRFDLYRGNIVGTDLGRTSGFGVFSLNGSYRMGKTALLSAGVDNLFDKTYAEHISRGGAMVAGFPAPTTRVNEMGRNLWMKASVQF